MACAGLSLSSFLIPSTEHKPQWHTVESERLSETVDNVTLVGKMDIFGLIGENDEGGRTDGYLG